MRHFLLLFCAILGSFGTKSLAVAGDKVEDKVKDKFVPAPLESQKIAGYLGNRIQINLEKRLLRVDEAALLAGFQHRPGKQEWIGEHLGKFLDAASNTYALTGDARLRAKMDRMVDAWLATQGEDGYLGTYSPERRWTSWDVWVHKYDLIGLLAYHRVAGNERALTAARKIGDLLTRTFGEGKRDIIASSTHVGMAATSVLEPICLLYRATGEPRYLEFAEYIVKSWEQPNGPKLVSSLTTLGNVYKTANAKAYEMMSDLVGVLELYRLTGNPVYLQMALNARNDIAARRLYITGTTSSHEHFQDDAVLPGQPSNDVGEGCATVTWLQLNWHLLRLTGQQEYADTLEQTVFNQLLAAQDPATGNICYFTPVNGRKQPRTDINCCQSSEPRGISLIPALTWGTLGQGFAIQLFTDGETTVPINGVKVRLTAATTYPDTGHGTFRVFPERPVEFPLMFRIPAWTRKATLRVNGRPQNALPGQYAVIKRKWSAGDEVVMLLDVTPRLVDGGQSYPNSQALVRGPQVLAIEKSKNPEVPYLHLAALDGLRESILSIDRTFDVKGIISNPEQRRTEHKRLKLVPFAEAQDYRVWLAKPHTLALGQPSVFAFSQETSSSRGTQDGSICDERPDSWRSSREAAPGTSVWWAVEAPAAVRFTRIVFRSGELSESGGWFSETPRLEIRRSPQGSWEPVGALTAYPAAESRPNIQPGQAFELNLPQPVEATGLRIAGKTGGKFATCAELAAY